MSEPSLIGERIRMYRLRHRNGSLTQEELSKLSGVPRTRISEVESGHRPSMSLNSLAKIAKALGVTLNDLAWLDEDKKDSKK